MKRLDLQSALMYAVVAIWDLVHPDLSAKDRFVTACDVARVIALGVCGQRPSAVRRGETRHLWAFLAAAEILGLGEDWCSTAREQAPLYERYERHFRSGKTIVTEAVATRAVEWVGVLYEAAAGYCVALHTGRRPEQ